MAKAWRVRVFCPCFLGRKRKPKLPFSLVIFACGEAFRENAFLCKGSEGHVKTMNVADSPQVQCGRCPLVIRFPLLFHKSGCVSLAISSLDIARVSEFRKTDVSLLHGREGKDSSLGATCKCLSRNLGT